MKRNYSLVLWPHVQNLMDIEGFKENSSLDLSEHCKDSSYFVADDWLLNLEPKVIQSIIRGIEGVDIPLFKAQMKKEPMEYLKEAVEKLPDSDKPYYDQMDYDGNILPILDAIKEALNVNF